MSTPAATPSANPFATMADVVCRVDVIVGTGTISVSQCLALQRNSLLRLAQPAGSDLTLVVHGIPLAVGAAVADGESTSVRVSEVLPPPTSETQS